MSQLSAARTNHAQTPSQTETRTITSGEGAISSGDAPPIPDQTARTMLVGRGTTIGPTTGVPEASFSSADSRNWIVLSTW
jgi:hypothetical protein